MNYLFDYVKSNYNIDELLKSVKIGYIENALHRPAFPADFSIQNITHLNLLDINKYTYEISKKNKTKGFYMNWHLDNSAIIKHKKSVIDNIQGQIKISDKHTIYYYSKKPQYTLLIYESSYNEHFTGGTLELIDGTIIYPKKNMYVFFDSNLPHKVNIITNGNRNNYLIKFYKI
jgi:hypothetical protein